MSRMVMARTARQRDELNNRIVAGKPKDDQPCKNKSCAVHEHKQCQGRLEIYLRCSDKKK